MPKLSDRDTLFAEPLGQIKDFSFDESVVRVFPDMLRRSVPGYQTIVTQCGLLAERFAQPGSNLYDLGCSLGATTFAMRERLKDVSCRLVAVDNSLAMIEELQRILQENTSSIPVDVRYEDIAQSNIENASVVVLNFTLQFFSPALRQDIIARIYQGMRDGGILIISEKIAFSDPQQQELHLDMYHQFKKANGYSDLEISQKRTALENVLIPDTLATHHQRIGDCGFKSSEVWFQCFNFASMVAIK